MIGMQHVAKIHGALHIGRRTFAVDHVEEVRAFAEGRVGGNEIEALAVAMKVSGDDGDLADEAQDTIRQIVRNRQADGVIFSGTRPADARVQLLQEAGLPFVTYGTTDAVQPHAYVDADNQGIIRACMARLIARGHRRIALLNPPPHLNYGQTRLATYRAMLTAAGLPWDEDLVAHGRLTPGYGRAQVIAMQALPVPPTAYIATNESTALGALSGFAACGLVHGRDAVINATDDLNVSAYFSPPLTTFYLPITRPAELLGRTILRVIAGAPPESLQTLLMPELMERCEDRLIA